MPAMLRSALSALAFLTTALHSQAFRSDTLYIVSGQFRTVDTTFVPAKGLSFDSSYSQQPPVIRLMPGEMLDLCIINLDTMDHQLTWSGLQNPFSCLIGLPTCLQIKSDGTMAYVIEPWKLNTEKVSAQSALGISAAVLVSSKSEAIAWQLREFQVSFSDSLSKGLTPDWSNYFPDYYTINGKSFPEVDADPTIQLNGKVGDTMWLWIWNAGPGIHSIHFHGFHQVAVALSNPLLKGSEKDTWPLFSGDWMLLYQVPDKPGTYPVHDHNLVAVSGGGLFPNGMMILMEVAP